MKIIFKEGQKVYDQIFKPDIEGEVRFVSINPLLNYLIVDFEDSSSLSYTIDGLMFDLEISYRHSIPTLSVKPYSADMQGFCQEEIELPPTVEDAVKWIGSKGDFYINELYYNEELYTSEEMYKAFEALKKLILLRDYYNKGWKPKIYSYTHIITTRNGKPVKDCLLGDFRILYFKSQEISNRFFEEQRELLEIAKPLL